MSRLIPITICLLLFISSSHAQNSIPQKWNTNMTLTFYTGPGMRPDSYTTVIKAGKCMYLSNDGHKADTSYFKLSASQLDSIAAIMHKYRFDKMEDDALPGIIYDKRTSSVTLNVDGKIFSLTESASIQISEKHQETFGKMREEIRVIIERVKKDAI
jgi:hypothetical protein